MKNPTSNPTRCFVITLSLMAAAAMSACGGLPPVNPELDQVRRDYQALQADPRVQDSASAEMKLATDAMGQAITAWNQDAGQAQVHHLVYLASQRLAIVRSTLETQSAQATVNAAAARRSQVQLEARTQEVDTARRGAEAAQQATAMAEREAVVARSVAMLAHRQTQAAMEQNQQLQARLNELNAQPSPRGFVITLGDVLFDVDRSALRPGGQRLVQKLAGVLNEFPQRTVLVEGHTDSTGSETYNQTLSTQRALAVRSALLGRGIADSRISTRGFGESSPVGSNQTAAGRQMNRRVEIVLPHDG